MTTVLEATGLEKRYGSDVAALRGVSLSIEEGELIAIVGPSGLGQVDAAPRARDARATVRRDRSGSTGIRRPSSPTARSRRSGRARSGSCSSSSSCSTAGRRSTTSPTACSTPALPLRERRARAEETLDEVGLAHRLGHRPNQLSGGERQRVAVARAVVGRPRILFADEPTGNLDTQSGQGVVSLLRALNRAGTTVVVITHERELAGSLPRRVELRDGVVELDTKRASMMELAPSRLAPRDVLRVGAVGLSRAKAAGGALGRSGSRSASPRWSRSSRSRSRARQISCRRSTASERTCSPSRRGSRSSARPPPCPTTRARWSAGSAPSRRSRRSVRSTPPSSAPS